MVLVCNIFSSRNNSCHNLFTNPHPLSEWIWFGKQNTLKFAQKFKLWPLYWPFNHELIGSLKPQGKLERKVICWEKDLILNLNSMNEIEKDKP